MIEIGREAKYRPRLVPMVAVNEFPTGSDKAITAEPDQSLDRAQRRLLRRIYNGRTVPIIADGKPFLTYKEASRYLLSLPPDAREKAYTEMQSGVAKGSGIQV